MLLCIVSSPKFFRKEEIADKIAIETTGKKLGKAKEIAVSLDGTAALFIEKDDGSETEIPMSRIIGVADFIIARAEGANPAPPATVIASPQTTAPMQPATAAACRNCGAPLKPGSKFCTKCGAVVV